MVVKMVRVLELAVGVSLAAEVRFAIGLD